MYVGVVGLNFALGAILGRPDTPRRKFIPDSLRFQSAAWVISSTAVVTSLFAADLVGFVGMFILWPPAPALFAIGTIGPTVVWPFFVRTGFTRTEWERACTHLEAMIGGFIIAVTLCGPARILFAT